jgi:hypothetical protein
MKFFPFLIKPLPGETAAQFKRKLKLLMMRKKD